MSDEEKSPLISDLTGLGKLANSELVKKAYDDALSPLMKEFGKAGQDVAKTARLILLSPFQLLSAAQDRFSKWIKQIAEDVPEERRQEAPAYIAGPVLQNLVFMEDENPLTKLYLELLKRAIDKERFGEAHPGFLNVIQQLSPDEAVVLFEFKLNSPARDGKKTDYSINIKQLELRYRRQHEGFVELKPFPIQRLVHPDRLRMYIDHLESLFILKKKGNHLRTSSFGRLFLQACIPEDFILPVASDK